MRGRGLVRTLALALLAFASASHAGSLRVGPTLIVLDAEHPVAVVRITNNNAATTSIDVRANAWQQVGNDDAYSETQHLIVTPPIFDLAAGETQTVRIGLNPSVARDAEVLERSFRVFVSELPDQRPNAAATQMLMRVGIPVFVSKQDLQPSLAWRLTQTDSGTWRLQATNHGSAHARVVRMDLKAAGAAITDDFKSAYILPGATHSWPIRAEVAIAKLNDVNLHVAYFSGNDETVKLTPRAPAPPFFARFVR